MAELLASWESTGKLSLDGFEDICSVYVPRSLGFWCLVNLLKTARCLLQPGGSQNNMADASYFPIWAAWLESHVGL